VTISFWDLHDGLKALSARKREAFFWNVLMDKKQKDVAKLMGITTVSVGQYVEQACLQLAERYFGEDCQVCKDTENYIRHSVLDCPEGCVQAVGHEA
jgi:hypothetical protein